MKNKPSAITLEKNRISLEEIARKLGKRTAFLNLIDPQVVRSPWDWRDSLSNKPSPSDFFSRKLSFKANNFRVILRINDEYLVAEIIGKFGDSVICSFMSNMVHDPSRKLASKSLCKAFGCKVYIPFPDTKNTLSILLYPSFQAFVKALHLSKKESLHIGNGYAHLYLQRFTSDDVFIALDILYQLLTLLPSAEEVQTDLEELPENFHKLIPLIKKWGICDDSERSDMISQASSNALAKLVDAVEPEFSAINTYLNSFSK